QPENESASASAAPIKTEGCKRIEASETRPATAFLRANRPGKIVPRGETAFILPQWITTWHEQALVPVQVANAESRQLRPLQHGAVGEQVWPDCGQLAGWQLSAPVESEAQLRPEQQSALVEQVLFCGWQLVGV